jgi:hypothetical protein
MAVPRTIRFRDLDGNFVEQDWYFSLDKTDTLEMGLIHNEDVSHFLNNVIMSRDSLQLLRVWKDLLIRSVGERQGRLLVKDDNIRREFRQGGAYEQLLMELVESDDTGAGFFLSIMPDEIQNMINEEQAREYSREELLSMTDEEFSRVAGDDESRMSRKHLMISLQRKITKAA